MALGHGPIASKGISGQSKYSVVIQKALSASSSVLVSRLRSFLLNKSVTSISIAAKNRVIAFYKLIATSIVVALMHLSTYLKSLFATASHSVSRVNRVGKNLSKLCTGTARRVYKIIMYRIASLSNHVSIVNRVGKNLSASFTIGNILLHFRTALQQLLSPAGATIGPIFRRFISRKRAISTVSIPRIIRFYGKAAMLVVSLVNPFRFNRINLSFVTDDPSTSEATSVRVRGDTKHFQTTLTSLAHSFNRVFKIERATVAIHSLVKRTVSLYRSSVGACTPVISKYRNLLKSISATSIETATMSRYRDILRSLSTNASHAVARLNQVGKNARATVANTVMRVKSVLMNRLATSTSIARRVRFAAKSLLATSIVFASRVRSISKFFSASSTILTARVNSALKRAHATATNVARRVNQVGKNSLATEASIVRAKKAVSLARAVVSAVIANRVDSLARIIAATSTSIATRTRAIAKGFSKVCNSTASKTSSILMNRSASGSLLARVSKSVKMARSVIVSYTSSITNSAVKYIIASSTAIANRARVAYKSLFASSFAIRSIIKSFHMSRSTLSHIGTSSITKMVKMNRFASSIANSYIVNSAVKHISVISNAVVRRARVISKNFSISANGIVNMMRGIPYSIAATSSTVARAIKMVIMSRFAVYSSIGLFVPQINRIFLATGSSLSAMQRFFGRNLLAVSSSVARMVRELYRNMLAIVSPLVVRGYNLFMYRSVVSTAFSFIPKTLIFAPKLTTSTTIAFMQPIMILRNFIVASTLVFRLLSFAFGFAKPNKSRTITVKPRVRTIKVRK